MQNPLRAREDNKRSNIHESVQVLHLFPFFSFCTSLVGVYGSNIFAGVLLSLPSPLVTGLSVQLCGASSVTSHKLSMSHVIFYPFIVPTVRNLLQTVFCVDTAKVSPHLNEQPPHHLAFLLEFKCRNYNLFL